MCVHAAYTYEIRSAFFFFFHRPFPAPLSRTPAGQPPRRPPGALPGIFIPPPPRRPRRRRRFPINPPVTCNALETFQTVGGGGGSAGRGETHRSGKCFGFDPNTHDTYDGPRSSRVVVGVSLRRNALADVV